MTTETAQAPADFVWGAEEIAKAIGRPRQATYHMLEKGDLPAKKVAGRWVANRQALVDALTVPA